VTTTRRHSVQRRGHDQGNYQLRPPWVAVNPEFPSAIARVPPIPSAQRRLQRRTRPARCDTDRVAAALRQGDDQPVSCSAQVPAGACTPSARYRGQDVRDALQCWHQRRAAGRLHRPGSQRRERQYQQVQVTRRQADGTVDRTFLSAPWPRKVVRATPGAWRPASTGCPNLLPYPRSTSHGQGRRLLRARGLGGDPGRVQFSDTVRATGTDAFGNVCVASVGSGVYGSA